MERISFDSDGNHLVGNLFHPPGYDPAQKYSTVVVSGSWTTVKEQMAGLYAQRLAEHGFICLAFDFSNFGESEGEPRFYEHPSQKVLDIKNAISWLQSRNEVDAARIGALGICAGSMYTLMATSEDPRIKAVVTVASWLQDAEAVKLIYGGEEGVSAKISAARAAKRQYAETGAVAYIPSVSETDSGAAMYGPYDYYLNPERGAVPNWSADKFAVMSWEDWLTLDPMPSAPNLNVPLLMVHSDGAVLPLYTRQYFNRANSKNKQLFWVTTDLESPMHQFCFYDQPAEVNLSVKQAARWFKDYL
ncbi:alpha/beta hydrolase [Endozoicomonas sp. SCSIO W0465]|uniref:alpha/beta hydrolase n=1 Tax=Endozoicomonas sp. SCSIO W0465 TaxID=2918516 RepID=UPI002075D7E1|nr:alpha/beta hydrolase [Endozoicomonas sp. SCSIO W0465]USE33888.1 alpha/beta hydrolase [Endozoicomonas sp. SCSIO W0465]